LAGAREASGSKPTPLAGGINVNFPAAANPGERSFGEGPLMLDAVLLYEDLGTGLRAKELFDCAARLFPGAPCFNLAIWRFACLWKSTAYKTALKDAFAAVILLLSSHGRRDLPKAVKAWLRQWIERKSDQPCALIVSLDESSRNSASAARLIASLRAGAKAKDVEVFSQFSNTPLREGNPPVEGNQRRAHAKTPVFDNIPRSLALHSHWGINE
jgi:hypothetical protein